MKKLEAYFADWDPFGFVKEGGAPLDEYSMEAEKIKKNFKLGMTNNELGELTYNTFVLLMGHDFPGFREQCLKRASDINKILTIKT